MASANSCYLRHSKVPVEEDLTHEFKAHRDLSKLDLSESKYILAKNGGYTLKIPRRRATLSKSICGMLNTGLKSTIYLGVTDSGEAEGFIMSLYQRDHFQLSLRDLLSKFDPPCPSSRIGIEFVPVFDADEDGLLSPESAGFDVPRWLEHAVRDSKYCWCDNFTMAASAHGIIHRFYVIELTIRPSENKQVFANEFGKYYIRKNGYTTMIGKDSLQSMKKSSPVAKVGRPKIFQDDSSNSERSDYLSYDEDKE